MLGITEEQPAQDVRENADATSAETSPFEKKEETKKDGPLGKLGELLNKHKNMVCTYEEQGNHVEIYTDGQNLKLVIKGEMGGKPYEATSLFTGDYLYNWSNIQEDGIKISTKNASENSNYMDLSTSLQEEFDIKADDIQYKCEEKALSANAFELPKDRTFHEIGLPKTDASGQIDMCGICETIEEVTEKDACRSQFDCEK